MSVSSPDSCDKITGYLQRLEIDRHNVYLSPTFFRSLICPKNCGACCQKFSLDYITKKSQEILKKEYPEEYLKYFKYRVYNEQSIFSDLQEDNLGRYCRFLDENARCKIHLANPVSCQMEPIKFRKVENRIYIGKQFFIRAWKMTKIDGTKGCLCEFEPYTKEQFQSDIQVLQDLNDVSIILKIKTVLPQVIDLLKQLGPNIELRNKIPIQIIGMDRLDKWR